MTVYVDDMRMPARVGSVRGRWSHLYADTREELHEFASRLGLKRAWFQDPLECMKPKPKPGSRAAEAWHYDVTDSKREQAIKLGAVPVRIGHVREVIDRRMAARGSGGEGNQ